MLPIKGLKVEKQVKNYITTLDIETIKKGNKLVPYLICAYNGTSYITTYADVTLNQKDLFKSFFDGLLTFFIKKSHILTVYGHNF